VYTRRQSQWTWYLGCLSVFSNCWQLGKAWLHCSTHEATISVSLLEQLMFLGNPETKRIAKRKKSGKKNSPETQQKRQSTEPKALTVHILYCFQIKEIGYICEAYGLRKTVQNLGIHLFAIIKEKASSGLVIRVLGWHPWVNKTIMRVCPWSRAPWILPSMC